MALGAMSANPGLKVRIVPVGLSYFHPHKFRSRAVVEFGAPLEVPRELVGLFEKGGDGKRKAVGEMMGIVFDGLKSVTVQAPDYETLMVSVSESETERGTYDLVAVHSSRSKTVHANGSAP
jgi:glycerol-3-phosphate O-acyltransferase/dihydroxyacetone phosphate acyltransferase